MTIDSITEFLEIRNSEDSNVAKSIYSRELSEELIDLIFLEYSEYLDDLAKNKKLPESVLWKLATNHSSTIRTLIAMKRNLPADLFLHLAKDQSDMVRRTLVYNKKISREAMEILRIDTEKDIRELAVRFS